MSKHLDGMMLRAFIEAARLGSINRAAKSLDRTQPITTQTLRRLEDVVGKQLLIRSYKGVSLTQDGLTLLPFARKIIELSDHILSELDGSKVENKQMSIKIGEDFVGEAVMKSVVSALESDIPVALQVINPDSVHLAESVASGETDIFIGEVFHNPPSTIVLRRTAKMPLVWAATPEFNRSTRPLPIALYPKNCPWRRLIIEVLTKHQIDWYPVVESESLAALQASARSGRAIIACLAHVLDPMLVPLEAARDGLPSAPEVEIALYRSPTTANKTATDKIELALWHAIIGSGSEKLGQLA